MGLELISLAGRKGGPNQSPELGKVQTSEACLKVTGGCMERSYTYWLGLAPCGFLEICKEGMAPGVR